MAQSARYVSSNFIKVVHGDDQSLHYVSKLVLHVYYHM